MLQRCAWGCIMEGYWLCWKIVRNELKCVFIGSNVSCSRQDVRPTGIALTVITKFASNVTVNILLT